MGPNGIAKIPQIGRKMNIRRGQFLRRRIATHAGCNKSLEKVATEETFVYIEADRFDPVVLRKGLGQGKEPVVEMFVSKVTKGYANQGALS